MHGKESKPEENAEETIHANELIFKLSAWKILIPIINSTRQLGGNALDDAQELPSATLDLWLQRS